MLERNEQPSQEQLCGECIATQPDLNCRYRESLAESVARVPAFPSPSKKMEDLLAGEEPVTIDKMFAVEAQVNQNLLAQLDLAQEVSNEMVEAYRMAAILGCPNLTTTEFPKIAGL